MDCCMRAGRYHARTTRGMSAVKWLRRRIYWWFRPAYGAMMSNDTKNDDGSPKFGKLLVVLVGAVVFCGVLTWVMGTYFPNFPS